MNFLKSLDSADAAKVGLLAIFSLPVAFVYACYKMNHPTADRPLTLEEQYPDEHLGI
jgi:hypothetical protein